MTALTKFLRRKKEKDIQNGDEENGLYKLVSNIAVIGVFASVAVLVLGIFKIFKMNSFIFGIVATIAVLSIACFLLLPWVRRFGNGESKKIALVFMALILACAILWLICVYMFIGIYNKSKIDGFELKSLVPPLNFVKITLIISLQFLMASLVAETVIRYKKKMIVFQAITYLSNFFFDFYITFFLGCLSITTEGLDLSSKAKILGNKFMVVMFVISIIYMAISSAIMKKQEAKRLVLAARDNYNIDGTRKSEKQRTVKEILGDKAEKQVEENQEAEVQVSQKPEEKLESLKNMLDKNLITQEEYDKKREEILKDM